ncbi:MAG TPA: UvrD-helicase domain-containing protein [Terriglobia bacterium]|nr:UvrD-helicase domain-containing protein [Terriglobia bacterium]
MPSVIKFSDRSDDAARRRIETSLGESLVVEAAAGTGKTSELVSRVVAVLKSGLTPVDKIVAVTFTRKAAGELKLRLRQELDRALTRARAASPPDAAEVRHLEAALAHLEEAHIGTIHSFCAEILRARPVEANIDPAFEELSEVEASRLYRQAFRRWSQEKLAAPPPGLRRCLSRLAFRGYQENQSPMDQLEAAGSRLIEWRDFPKPWSARPFDREGGIDGLVRQVLALADLSAKCQRSRDYLFEDLRPIRDTAGAIRRLEEVAARDYDTLEGLLIKLSSDLKSGKKRKGGGAYAESVKREDVVAAREDLMQALAEFKDGADADLATLLQSEMVGDREKRELVARYRELKQASGKLDFVDLLIHVHELIKSNQAVREYLQNRITHIFVDEFQDTDPLQARILLLLVADDPRETNGLDARPKPGKLFLVGDPKQSVYRFRRADVVLYQYLRETLRAKGVGVVQLRKSWRAVRPLQEFVNAAFESEMTGNVAAGQPDYVPLEKHAEARTDQPCLIALPVPDPYGPYGGVTKAAVEQSLPDTIGAFVAWLLDRSKNQWKVRDPEDPNQAWIPIQPRHICILFRRFVSWRFQGGRVDVTREYLRALETRDIPHLLVGARSFHQREEVETLRAALTAIEWPDDELAIFATLKGSLFSIPDSLLLRFKKESGSLHPFRPQPEPLKPEFAPVREAIESLAELHRRRNSRPIVETVNALLEGARSHAGFALRPAGNQVLANVYRIADLARSFELSGGLSFRGFVEELTTQAEREESGEAPVLEAGAEGVRVMTVHGAKGLEFPVVILADITCRLASQEPDLYVDAQQGLCAMRLVGCVPWELLEHQDEERERDRAEGVRVAYVAATRARDLLVVPAVEDQASWEGIFRTWGDGWLAPLHKALYPPQEDRRKAAAAPGVPRFGESTVITQDDRLIESSIKPGLHRPQQGKHTVVWWDPKTLDPFEKEGNFGVRQAEVLQEEGDASREGLKGYDDWKARRERTIEMGRRLEFEVFTPTESLEGPPGFEAAIGVEMIAKPAGRPQGPRFGTLVHTVLRDVELGVNADGGKVEASGRAEIERLAKLHARVLGSPPQEIEAAVEAVSAALAHPLLERASRAARRHRELPIILKTEGGRLLEGNIDLAFLEDGQWTVVDFKTDADLPARRPQYRHQLEWYVFALSRMTQQPARGWLLGI